MTTTVIPLMGSKLWRKKLDSRRLGVTLRFFFGGFWWVLGPWESSAGVYVQQPMFDFSWEFTTYKQLYVDSQEPGPWQESQGMLQAAFFFPTLLHRWQEFMRPGISLWWMENLVCKASQPYANLWCLNLNKVWLNVYKSIWIAAEIADWSDTPSWYNLQQQAGRSRNWRKCSRKFCFRATSWKNKTPISILTILPVAQTWGSYGDAAAILVWRPGSSREWIGGEGYCSKALTNRVGLSSWSSNSKLILFSCDRSTSPDFFWWFLGSGIHWMFSLSYESLDLGYRIPCRHSSQCCFWRPGERPDPWWSMIALGDVSVMLMSSAECDWGAFKAAVTKNKHGAKRENSGVSASFHAAFGAEV